MFAGRGATVLFRRVTQAASRRAFSSGGGSSKRFGWKSKLAAVAITGAGVYNVTYHLTHPAPENEIIQDMLLAQTTKDQVRATQILHAGSVNARPGGALQRVQRVHV
jgi:hypothetical protein